MKVQILQENFYKALSVVSRFTAQQSQLPILSHIGIEAKDKQLYLVASDIQLSIRLRVAAKILTEGSVGVPSRILVDLIKSMRAGMIELELRDDQIMLLRSGGMNAKIQGISMRDFPMVEEAGNMSIGSIGSERLNVIMRQLGFCISNDDSRPILTGIYWQPRVGLMAATDGFRLSVVNEALLVKTSDIGDSLVLNGRLLLEGARVFSEDTDKIELLYDKGKQQLQLKNEEIVLAGRVLQGEYPNFEGIMPKNIVMTVEVDREELLRTVKSVAIFARDNAHIIELKVKSNELVIEGKSAQVGENISRVEIVNETGSSMEIAFNSSYLLDFLQQSVVERVRFGLQGSLDAAKLTEVGDESFTHVIMPMRIPKD